jgi:hypothetical protein
MLPKRWLIGIDSSGIFINPALLAPASERTVAALPLTIPELVAATH